jgi:hypothetical protein
VDQAKTVILLDLVAPTSVRELCTTLGHTEYYRWFIQSYVHVGVSLEKLLCKNTKCLWTKECKDVLDTLKEKLVIVSILVFPDWSNIFHVHVDMSSIVLDTILV